MNELEIGRRIAKLRKERGFTQKDLADFLGVTDKAVSRWESGAGNPDISLLPKLAKLLGTTTDYLLSAQTDSTPFAAEFSKGSLSTESGDNKEKPLRIFSTLAKAFVVLGAVVRCGVLFALSLVFRNAPRGETYYILAICLSAIDAVLCCVTFAQVDKATSKNQLIAIGILNLIFCGGPSGVFLFCIPKREFYEPRILRETDGDTQRKTRTIVGLAIAAVGIGFIVASVACFGMAFFLGRGNYPSVSGYKVMFDYDNCFYYAKGSSGWLVFSYFGEFFLALISLGGASYWLMKMLRPEGVQLSFKPIIVFGTLLMIMGWTLGILISNCDTYTQYKVYQIPMGNGPILASVFCIVGSNLCGIAIMVPLRRIVRVSVNSESH